jgi:hypothetical protein
MQDESVSAGRETDQGAAESGSLLGFGEKPPVLVGNYRAIFTVSASFFTTLFLLGHNCNAGGLSRRTRNLCCGLILPGFETGLAESCVIVRNQCSFAQSRSRVKRVRVSDDFAGIVERGQAPPDQVIDAKLFRAANFDYAVYRLTYGNPAHATRNIVGGHRLEKHMWQMHLIADHRNVGQAFEELEKLRRTHYGVGD